MLRKYASAAVLDTWRVTAAPGSLRKAAHRVTFDYVPRAGFLYVRARAISSRCNDNWDAFPAGEIEKGYRTFLGKPVFVNHHNSAHRRARGVIVAAAIHRDRNPDGSPDTWVELLHEIDAQTFPKFAKAILSGRVNRTSMGVDCEYSTCSACGNRATSPAEYCQHMPGRKGMKIRQRNQRTGRLEEKIIHEICAGLTFFENSFLVEDPADPSAYVLDKPYLHKAAARTAALDDDEPDFRDLILNKCTTCGQPVHFNAANERRGRHPWRHHSPLADDHPAAPSDPGDRRPSGSYTFGGTDCLVCHEPVKINLAALGTATGGWHHHDGMKRDHPAIPADPRAVYDQIPVQRAQAEQARLQVRDQMHRQFEQLSGGPLPRRPRGDEGDMPPDPFLASRTAAGDDPYILRVMRHMTEAHGVPQEVLPFLAAQKYRDAHGRNIHPPGEREGPEGESAQDKIKRQTDSLKSFTEGLEGLQLAHHELHGGDYPAEGGMAGTRHRHGYNDELAYRHEHPWRPDTYRPGHEEPPEPRSAGEERAVVQPYAWRGEGGIPEHMRNREYKSRLHPGRTDEFPNREIYDTDDDPDKWSNLGSCPRTYTRRQQDRSYRAGSGEPGTGAPHGAWRAWREKARRNGAFCTECGAHKWMHAEFRPSEVGRPKPEYEEEKRTEWGEKVRGRTAPLRPLMPHMNSRKPDLLAHFAGRKETFTAAVDLPEAACPSCGSPRARAYSRMHEMAQCSDCGTHFNHYTGREMGPEEVEVTNAANANYEEYEERRKKGGELFSHVTEHPTHPVPGWDEAREWRSQWHREDLQPNPMSGTPLPRYPPRRLGDPEADERLRQRHEDWARQRREHVTHAWSSYDEPRIDPTGRERLSVRRQAITGEEAEPGHEIWARPAGGKSPVAAEVYQNMHTREPGEHGEAWYHGVSYHGPDHVIRHPDTREVWVVDREGRDASPAPQEHGYGVPERDGQWQEDRAYEHWHDLESQGPDAARIGTSEHPRFSEVARERTPAFPHSRIDPEDERRAQRPDARVHEPQGYSPEDEWHGPYEVVKHPQTGKFHVVDNAGRHAPMGGWQGFRTQLQAERSRDYIDHRQQSKERGRELANSIYDKGMEVLDPGGTEESRESEENTRQGQDLMTRYAGGRGQLKTEPDEEGGRPYYEREHYHENGRPTGWYVKHYGGPQADVYHRATGDAEDTLWLPEDEHGGLHRDFDDIELGRHLKAWYHNPDGMRRHLEEEPWQSGGNERIQRWKRRHQGARHRAAPGWDGQAAADADNAYRLSGCHHASCGRWLGGGHTAAALDIAEERLHRPADPALRPVPLAVEGARAYSAAAGLDDPHREPYGHIETNPGRIRRLAQAYHALPMDDPGAHAAFADMAAQVHRQYDHLTNRMGVRVEAVDYDPYENHLQMADDLENNRHLAVLSTRATGPHGFFDDETNDEFRAVHDAFGHAATGRSFDRHGEEAAWLAHSRMFHGAARQAMTTETRGQNSTLIATGNFAPQKTALLPAGFLRREAAAPWGPGPVPEHAFLRPEHATHCVNCGMPFTSPEDDPEHPDTWRDVHAPHLCTQCAGPRHLFPNETGKPPPAEVDPYGGQPGRMPGRTRRWTPDDPVLFSLSALERDAALRYKEPEDHPFFLANPVSKDHIKHAWNHHTTQDERDQASRWYPDAHLVAVAIAHGDAAKGAGLLAAYSPLTRWPANMFNAARSIHEGRAMGTRKGDGAIMAVHWKPAQRILAGEHYSDVLSPKTAMKTRAFAHLIEHGGNTEEDLRHGTPHVCIDRHALSVAIGRRVTDEEYGQAPVSKHRYYHHVARQYIDAARDISDETGKLVDPATVQAGTWLAQVRRNETEDATMRGRLGRGRVTRGQQDVHRWQDYAREHHPDLSGETMHLGALQMLGGDPPLRVPPSVDTLRPEACPVCGNSDVFKGQRCPVCGFVSPPDIFRDPDIDQARANRAALEEGAEESPYPEGPADEEAMLAEQGIPGAEPGMNPEQVGSGEDAQDQLMHPDQIAPDGIPGVQPEAAPGQGMLEPSGEEEQPAGEDELAQPGELDENGEPVPPEEEQLEGEAEAGAGRELEEAGTRDEEEQEEAAEEGLSPGKEQDEDERPGGKMPKRNAAASVTAAQDRAVAELRRENAVLRRQLQFVAELAGIGPELDEIRRRADLANPAQPVPDPAEEPPTSTTEQALATGAPTGSGSGTARGPGHTEDDPSRPGTTPGSLTAVPAEQTTTAITPGVEMQTPPARQLIDVTAPVTGTNPSQDGGVPIEQRRIETDVRVNPNPLAAQGPGIGGAGNDGTAFPWTMAARQVLGPGEADERGARTMAAIRLARLQVQAGLARGDELEVGSAIEANASLSLHDIEHEISTITRMARATAAAQPRYPRGMAPRQAAKAAPSFAGPPAPVMAMTAAADSGDDSDLFID